MPFLKKYRLLELSEKFQEGCIIGAASELNVFSKIPKHGILSQKLSLLLKADQRALTMLLDALTSMKILKKNGTKYFLSPYIKKYLSVDSTKSVTPMIIHRMNMMRKWVQLSKVVKTGKPATKSESFLGKEADTKAFIQAMHVINEDIATKLVNKINVNFKHVLDVGGASGTWLLAWLKKKRYAKGTIFDLPHAIKLAKSRINNTSFKKRVHFSSGDFYKDNLPSGADFVWVSAIIHQNSRQENRNLFKKIFLALPKKGTIAIRDFVMNNAHTLPYRGALFAINMLVATKGGRTYSFKEIKEDLLASGFKNIKHILKEQNMHSIVIAEKN